MGLDMYAFAIDPTVIGNAQVDFFIEDEHEHEFYYWRKFNHLHGWMKSLYHDKGGTSKSFNCDNVRLETADLDKLEVDWKANKLESMDGFFFGSQLWHEEHERQLSEFLIKAREALAAGKAVYYTSWW